LIDVPPRATSHPLGRFVNESLRSAGMLALVLLIVEVLMQVPFAAPPGRLLAIVLAVGIANTALLWVVKAKLRTR
jgi:hypothetical protein